MDIFDFKAEKDDSLPWSLRSFQQEALVPYMRTVSDHPNICYSIKIVVFHVVES